MITDELDEVSCYDCGTTVALDDPEERSFALTPEILLCYACAVRRGGVYDDADDKWRIAPRLEGIAADRQPHA